MHPFFPPAQLKHGLVLLGLAVAGCSSAEALPLRYFVSEYGGVSEEDHLGTLRSSGAASLFSAPIQEVPVLPFVAWGLRFDEDLMVSIAEGGWGMAEVAKVLMPDGSSLWFSLDSMRDGRQYVGLPDDPRAAEAAAHFPAPSYEAGLEVIEAAGRRPGRSRFDISYVRMDGTPMEFSIEAKDGDKPPARRNGHAMNHSQGRVLALLDIFSLRLARPLWRKGQGHRVQRIAGVPISGRMRQVVGGLRSGSWTQRSWGLEGLDEADVILARRSLPGEELLVQEGFPSTVYRFSREEDRLELRAIEVYQSLSPGDPPILQIRFNPSLPDLRYGPPLEPHNSKMSIEVNGREGYQTGEVQISKDGSDAKLVLLSSRPDWAHVRPLASWIRFGDGESSLRSCILASTAAEDSRSEHVLDSPSPSAWALSHAAFRWEKRPHRMSLLQMDLPQEGEPVLSIQGGTWATGEKGSDRASVHLRQQELLGGSFYSLQTPEFPLVQSGKEESLLGVHHLHLFFPGLAEGERIQPWINGFSLSAGPLHTGEGITVNGLRAQVQSLRQEGRILHLSVVLEQSFGSVPDRRQDMDNYSALGRVELGFVALPDDAVWERTDAGGSETVAGGLFREPQPGLGPGGAIGLLQEYSIQVQDSGRNPGRYLRALELSAALETGHDLFDNSGAVTRQTAVEVQRTLLWSPQLQHGGTRERQWPLE
jgi:hypothetical protein